MSDWQPIETAPKDGTYILGYGPHGTRGHYIGDIHFFIDRWTIEWMNGYGAPTHWQPLPEPPTEATLQAVNKPRLTEGEVRT